MSAKSKTFEASMERLETIVRQLEQGNVPLEESLKLFQEGTALVQSCTKLLDGAETEIVKLMKTADGTPAETEYVRDEWISGPDCAVSCCHRRISAGEVL